MSPAVAILLAAIISVESGGNNNAAGSLGELGCLQIRPVVVRDLNRIAKRQRFTLEDRRLHCKSVEMFRAYMDQYATAERIGREPTLEDMARIWNGGPRGYSKLQTLAYWSKVRAAIYHNATR